MNPILSGMLHYVEFYRYFAVFGFTFLGAFALPLPTGSMMIACAFLASIGIFDIWTLLFVGIFGNIIGDHAGYWLARKLEEKVAFLPLLGRVIHHERFQSIAGQVHRFPWFTILFSRFMTAVAPSVNIVAGFSRYPYAKFWFFEGLGEGLEVSVCVALGWWFGREWQKASEYLFIFLGLVVLGVVSTLLFWKWLGKRAVNNAGA